jgi:hypothetical protein
MVALFAIILYLAVLILGGLFSGCFEQIASPIL